MVDVIQFGFRLLKINNIHAVQNLFLQYKLQTAKNFFQKILDKLKNSAILHKAKTRRSKPIMSTASEKMNMNIMNNAANLYSWQLSILESSQEHSFGLCCYLQQLLIQNFLIYSFS